MTAKIIDGKKIAQNIKQNIKQNVQKSKPLLKISWTGYHYEPLEIVN